MTHFSDDWLLYLKYSAVSDIRRDQKVRILKTVMFRHCGDAFSFLSPPCQDEAKQTEDEAGRRGMGKANRDQLCTQICCPPCPHGQGQALDKIPKEQKCNNIFKRSERKLLTLVQMKTI